MNYNKIEDPCFVCKAEDELGEKRGSMSHPINCGWKIKENDALRVATLEELHNIIDEAITALDNGDEKVNGLEYAKEITIRAILGKV